MGTSFHIGHEERESSRRFQKNIWGALWPTKVSSAHVFIGGAGELARGIATDLVIAGVKKLTIHPGGFDEGKVGSGECCHEGDPNVYGKAREDTFMASLAELDHDLIIQQEIGSIADKSGVYWTQFDCVILTDTRFEQQVEVNRNCREGVPPVKFISASIQRPCYYVFCDFGDYRTSERPLDEPLQVGIRKGNPTTISILGGKMQGLLQGDQLRVLEDDKGSPLVGQVYSVMSVSSNSFTINVDSKPFEGNETSFPGRIRLEKSSTVYHFHSLESQLRSSSFTVCEQCSSESTSHETLHIQNGMLMTSQGQCCPAPELNYYDTGIALSVISGITSNEILKCITEVYSPLYQWSIWLWLDFNSVKTFGGGGMDDSKFQGGESLGDHHTPRDVVSGAPSFRFCIVGCNAICRALLTCIIGSHSFPSATISLSVIDRRGSDDSEQKEFLKESASKACSHAKHYTGVVIWYWEQKDRTVLRFYGRIGDNSRQYQKRKKVLRMLPETEGKVQSVTLSEIGKDAFIAEQDVVVAAVDTVTERRSLNACCVKNNIAMIDIGIEGLQGHVQVIVPHITESYSSQRDPPTKDAPYCTVKSFPEVIDHTVHWARDKFIRMFCERPAAFNKFWQAFQTPQKLFEAIQSRGMQPNGFQDGLKPLFKLPSNFLDCLMQSRLEFEKHFNFKAKQILHSLPPSTLMPDGSLFWRHPKKCPHPITFSFEDPLHVLFLTSTTKLISQMYNIQMEEQDLSLGNMKEILKGYILPTFHAEDKLIETDPEAAEKESVNKSKIDIYMQFLKTEAQRNNRQIEPLVGQKYSKYLYDDDHADFVYAASNLRASMYGIDRVDRFDTRCIAGHLVPMSVSAIEIAAGLATAELIKVLDKRKRQDYRNTFFNLALPTIIRSEPAAPTVTVVRDTLKFTEWDKLHVHGNNEFTLEDFVNHFKDKFSLQVSLVVQGVKIIYMPFMPGHSKRLKNKMCSLLDSPNGSSYTDLTVSFENSIDSSDETDLPAPPVRYWLA